MVRITTTESLTLVMCLESTEQAQRTSVSAVVGIMMHEGIIGAECVRVLLLRGGVAGRCGRTVVLESRRLSESRDNRCQ